MLNFEDRVTDNGLTLLDIVSGVLIGLWILVLFVL